MGCSEKAEEIMQIILDMMEGNIAGRILTCSGLSPRLDPTSLLRGLLLWESGSVARTYAGALAVIWTHLKRVNRCLAYQDRGQQAELQREKDNLGHENWNPEEFPEWLLLELELDLMIRPLQVEVARRMMRMPDGGNGVLQLNMGEGKTSVIVPMLCSVLGRKKKLCRVTVLGSMFNMNEKILSFAIGGLLNRRVYTFPCRRDMQIDESCVDMIQRCYQECLSTEGVVLTLSEHRLSFRLLAYDNILKKEVGLGMKLLQTENWLRAHARDVLDESDELLNVKYQLVYTVGEQISLDGGELRWVTCQKLLRIVQEVGRDLERKHGPSMIEFYGDEMKKNPHQFAPMRLLDAGIYEEFVAAVADRYLEGIIGMGTEEKGIFKQFLTQERVEKSTLEKTMELFKDSQDDLHRTLIVSGYLRRSVLTLGLSKRWRVEYGVDGSKSFRSMAVPFRAKDVPAERTEFGHPDLAILLTHLSYYYSGLSDKHLDETLKLLKTKQGSEAIYQSWMQEVPEKQLPGHLSTFHALNLKDASQRQELFALLRRHRLVIDFWLGNKVFPRESQQFPAKLVMTSWDLVYEKRGHPVTGFSGTNDSSILLPLNITQQDLPELLKTNAEMEAILLGRDNGGHRGLKMGVSCREILGRMKEDKLSVLIDAGALMLECSNEQVASMWLEVDRSGIEAVVFFNKRNELVVKSRGQQANVPFELSSFQGRLSKCGVFLDDQHTRGTDLKFRDGARACVTIGGKMKRDKLIQACWRMRQLGKGHTATFYLSHEAHTKVNGQSSEIATKQVLEWVRRNTQSFNEDGLIYWAIAGKNYAQRLAAEDHFYAPKTWRDFTCDEVDSLMEGKAHILGEQCVNEEVTTLKDLYGQHYEVESLVKIIPFWFKSAMEKLRGKNSNQSLPTPAEEAFLRIGNEVVARCHEYVPNRTYFSSANMDEEQEKELELERQMEVEEEQIIERRRKAHAATHTLHDSVKAVVLHGEPVKIVEGIMRLCDVFKDTTFWAQVQPEGWAKEMFATSDFIRVLAQKYVKTDLFLRPVEYLVTVEEEEEGKVKQVLLLSPYEVNELMPHFRSGKVTCRLRMFSGRRSDKQDLLLNEEGLMLPKKLALVPISEESSITAALLLASGNLYFRSMPEQRAFARYLGLAPRPWSKEEEAAFEKGQISKNGFMLPWYRIKAGINGWFEGFNADPSWLARQILMARHPVLSEMAHVVRLLDEKCYVQLEPQNPST